MWKLEQSILDFTKLVRSFWASEEEILKLVGSEEWKCFIFKSQESDIQLKNLTKNLKIWKHQADYKGKGLSEEV